ncbi:chemotaxis protein CheW [Marinisporobacter balticus]|uniref:Purine-binding chemotaxis protein CheW n=1 Tax=Marinisporobacter balticus TaxID=2018667 RepID=A0A4R2KQD3_9FIRM|nr:chemotaxis protein CheW [Marinisporobacter balticus]TCO73136.1 purine-binding chemotaxis protein CheW [Marinisporobacter balticus]
MTKDIEDIVRMEDLESEEDTQRGKFLIFSLGEGEYGIEIKYVIEIIRIQEITPIPDTLEYIKGVINLRGKIIPVMDVRHRFKKEERVYDDRTCIVVIEVKEVFIGLIVDRVVEVASIADTDIALPPKINKNTENKYIKGIGKSEEKIKLLLDCAKLLGDDEINMIQELT